MSYQKLKNNMDSWNTGDILLFHHIGKGCFSSFGKFIQTFTGSNYSHVGMILKDPNFTEKPLVGIYFWESSWENFNDVEDNEKKVGVEIVDLNELISRCGQIQLFYRKLTLHDRQIIDNETLKRIHNTVHNKPYDIVPLDWIEAFLKCDTRPQKRDRFWCSALMGYIFVQLGLLPPNTDWSIMRPSDFSSERKDLPLINATLEKEVRIK